MPVIIEEITTEALKPVATPKTSTPPTEMPASTQEDTRKIFADLRRAEARAARLSAR